MSRRRRAVADLRRQGADPLVVLLTERRLRLDEHRAAITSLEKDLRVMGCFSEIRKTWVDKSCRHKIRIVLGHGVALSPIELSRLLNENLNSVRSTLARMRGRGEIEHVGHGKWIRPDNRHDEQDPGACSVPA